MQYKLLQPDGSLIEKSSGCWGAVGRSDYYRLPVWKKIKEFNNKLGTSGMASSAYVPNKTDSSSPSYLMDKKDTIGITLDSATGWGNLFHKSAYQLMEYIVERSPFRVTFSEGTRWADCYAANRLDVRIDLCPAQITSTLLIWLRDVLKSNKIQRTYDFIRSLGFNDGTSFCTTIHQPYLYAMGIYDNTPTREAFGKHALDFWLVDNPTIEHWQASIPHMFPMTMKEMGGYPTNMIGQWSFVQGKHMPRYGVVRAKTIEYRGLFGTQTYNGVEDATAFIKTFWGLE